MTPRAKPVDPNEFPNDWVLRKRGYFYRPNARGYTDYLHEAGRWSYVDAIRLGDADGRYITVHHASEFVASRDLIIARHRPDGQISQFGPYAQEDVIKKLPISMMGEPDAEFIVAIRGNGLLNEAWVRSVAGGAYLLESCGEDANARAKVLEMIDGIARAKSQVKVSRKAVDVLTGVVVAKAKERITRDGLITEGVSGAELLKGYALCVASELGLQESDINLDHVSLALSSEVEADRAPSMSI